MRPWPGRCEWELSTIWSGLLADRTAGAHPGGAAWIRRTSPGILAGRPSHRLRGTAGDPGRPVALTAAEFDPLRQLAVNAGRVLSYETPLRRVWGRSRSRDLRLVRAFMKKHRQKLGDDSASPAYIFTVHQVGYRMAKADPA